MLVEEMKQHTRIFRMDTAEKILQIVRANIVPYTNEVVEESIKDLIQDILAKEGKIQRLEELLTPLLKETGYQLQTIPGVTTVMAGKIISEVGNINRFKSEKQLAKFCGVAPISVGSVKTTIKKIVLVI